MSESSGHIPENPVERRLDLEQKIAEREIELVELKNELAGFEQTSGVADTAGANLREANAHLVMATIAAEHSEERAMATRRQQDEFLAMLAHELRNPLSPIRSSAALLARLSQTDPRLTLIHEVIDRQVTHMARLLDDLLDASRVTSGKVTLQRRPTRVDEFVMQAVEFCRVLIDGQGQQLTLDMPITAIYVDGDPARLAQIVGNLLHNAAKYTQDHGSIALSVRPEGNSVVIKISDDGPGISSESQATIFDLFTQEQRSLSRSQGGLGIGLTVVRNMVEQHGGTVSVHSDGLGKGSAFTVTLPRIHGVIEPATTAAATGETLPRRILVVDDKVDAGLMLSMLLEMYDHKIEIALDGPACLATYNRMHPDVVVCDIGLPGMNGYEVAQELKKLPGPCAFLIALTGYNSEADRAKAAAAGFDKHFAKPVSVDELLQLIKASPSLL